MLTRESSKHLPVACKLQFIIKTSIRQVCMEIFGLWREDWGSIIIYSLAPRYKYKPAPRRRVAEEFIASPLRARQKWGCK